jgi:hypothetical protein
MDLAAGVYFAHADRRTPVKHAAIVVVVVVSACALQRAETARRAQTELVGMQKRDLFACAGLPVRDEKVDDLEFLVYEGGGDVVGASTSHASATAWGNTVSGNQTTVAKATRRYCQATFTLKDGVVQRVTYQGRTGGLLSKGEQCAFVVEACLK